MSNEYGRRKIMSLLLTGGAVFADGAFRNMDIAIDQGRIVSVSLPR